MSYHVRANKLIVYLIISQLCSNIVLEASSVILYTTSHHGKLAVGSTYAELVSFQIPHALSGNFSFVIVTDVFNNVYENVFENDNYNSTQVSQIL